MASLHLSVIKIEILGSGWANVCFSVKSDKLGGDIPEEIEQHILIGDEGKIVDAVKEARKAISKRI